MAVGDHGHHQSQVTSADVGRLTSFQDKRCWQLSAVVLTLVVVPPLGGIKPWVSRPLAVAPAVGSAEAQYPVIGAEQLIQASGRLQVQHLAARLFDVAQRLGEAGGTQLQVELGHLLPIPLVDAFPTCWVQELSVCADATRVVKQPEPVVGQHTIETNHLVMPGLPGHDQLAGEGCRLRHPCRAEVVVQRVWLRIHEVRLPAS